VTHYYSHPSVATIRLESGTLRVGDVMHIRGHTTDFSQKVESLEVNHAPATEVGPNDDFGLKVVEPARARRRVQSAFVGRNISRERLRAQGAILRLLPPGPTNLGRQPRLQRHALRKRETSICAPCGMWRRTYARHCAALARIERTIFI
jgi:hypothetical protein